MAEQKYQKTFFEAIMNAHDIFIILFLKHIFMSIETDFRRMFDECKHLKCLKGMAKWNISNENLSLTLKELTLKEIATMEATTMVLWTGNMNE